MAPFNRNIEFINVNLSTDETAMFKEFLRTGEYDLGDMLNEILIAGFTVSIKYNDQRQAYYCTLIGSEVAGKSKDKGFSSFAGEPAIALMLAHYKLVGILNYDLTGVSIDNNIDFG